MLKTSNIKQKIINRLLYTNSAVIDKPGVLIHKYYFGLGIFEKKRRMTYFFEDPLVEIHKSLEKTIGIQNW